MSDSFSSDPPSPSEYGVNYIRERREELNLSQADVAEKLDVSEMSVSRWEREGSLTVERLGRVAELLQCSPAQLVPAAPRTYVLTREEEQLLVWFRSVGSSERRSITTLARGLHDNAAPPAFEQRKPAAG